MSFACSICFDTLDEDSLPVATLCGHLYCLDCAAHTFARDGAACVVCHKPHTLEAVVRLYPNSDESVETAESSSQASLDIRVVIHPGRRSQTSNGNTSDMNASHNQYPQEMRVSLPHLSHEEETNATLQTLLKSLRATLFKIDSRLVEMAQAPQLHIDIEENKRQCHRHEVFIQQERRALKNDRTHAAESSVRVQDQGQRRVADLRARIQAAADELAYTKDKSREFEAKISRSEEDVKSQRAAAVRRKKKYYALKAEVRGHTRSHDSDDSLEVQA